jgi:hypothetical protein
MLVQTRRHILDVRRLHQHLCANFEHQILFYVEFFFPHYLLEDGITGLECLWTFVRIFGAALRNCGPSSPTAMRGRAAPRCQGIHLSFHFSVGEWKWYQIQSAHDEFGSKCSTSWSDTDSLHFVTHIFPEEFFIRRSFLLFFFLLERNCYNEAGYKLLSCWTCSLYPVDLVYRIRHMKYNKWL